MFELDEAIRMLDSGDAIAAERICRRVLSRFPEHSSALHLLGLAMHRSGRHVDGAALMRRSILLAPRVPEFLNNLALVLSDTDDLEEAASPHSSVFFAASAKFAQ
jgi:Flp pilus assembly protein TadD